MIQQYSKLMAFFLKNKWGAIAWSLRRLYVPVKKQDLVLEVGSGGNPYFRSNVLLDAYLDTQERHYAKLITDRPTVLGYVENLPFKDDSFDFVIASHVLEHSKEPEKFLSEIQRVAKAGYIEVPDAFFERLNCYVDHRLEITDVGNELLIRKKKHYIQDEEVLNLFSNKVAPIFGKIVSKYPFHFNVRYYWSKKEGGIKYTILNPDYEFDWESPQLPNNPSAVSFIHYIKAILLTIIRKLFSQNKRNRKLNIMDYLQCPKCKNHKFHEFEKTIQCINCKCVYEIIENKIIKFN